MDLPEFNFGAGNKLNGFGPTAPMTSSGMNDEISIYAQKQQLVNKMAQINYMQQLNAMQSPMNIMNGVGINPMQQQLQQQQQNIYLAQQQLLVQQQLDNLNNKQQNQNMNNMNFGIDQIGSNNVYPNQPNKQNLKDPKQNRENFNNFFNPQQNNILTMDQMRAKEVSKEFNKMLEDKIRLKHGDKKDKDSKKKNKKKSKNKKHSKQKSSSSSDSSSDDDDDDDSSSDDEDDSDDTDDDESDSDDTSSSTDSDEDDDDSSSDSHVSKKRSKAKNNKGSNAKNNKLIGTPANMRHQQSAPYGPNGIGLVDDDAEMKYPPIPFGDKSGGNNDLNLDELKSPVDEVCVVYVCRILCLYMIY